MTDRELLEAAAKAAGIELADFQSGLPGQPLWMARGQENPETGSRDWNPLSSDGDALRLAVKLNIHIEFAGPRSVVDRVQASPKGYGHFAEVVMYEGDPAGATRRAIVRAAASIGKTGEPT